MLSYILLFAITLLTSSPIIQCDDLQDFTTELNTLQQSINIVVAQSNIDPDIAQDILTSTNNLNLLVQNNIQEDNKDIRVASALNSILETSSVLIQALNTPNTQNLFNDLKHATRINTLHKFIIAAVSGKLIDQPYYTDPYIESIGFTINNWIINGLLQALLQNVHITIPGTAMMLDTTLPLQAWLLQAAAGVIAHYSWLLQKKVTFAAQTTQPA